MRKSLLLSFVLLTHFTWSQNLVLNPDLETYSPCPSGIGSLESAANWFCPNTTCTSEYFNTCSTSPYSRVPKNYWGYEEPHCGNGYGGIYLWDASGLSYREYMVVKLADTLEAGQCYDLTFYVSLGNNCMLTTDAIGAKFRYTLDTNLYTTFPGMAPAHISNPTGTFFDTLGWTPVNGTYTATGGEKFLLIGNFEHDSSTDTLHYNTSASLNVIYVYIDDVCLHTCGGWCGGCGSPSGEENLTEEKARVYPNPFENSLTIDHAELVQEFILYDVFGKLIFSQAVTQNTINTQLLPGGLYIYEIRLKDGDVKKGKLVKE